MDRNSKKRQREREDYQRYGPAAAALSRNRSVFRDGRESTKQVTVQSILRDAEEMHRFHSTAATSTSGNAIASEILIHSKEELALYRQKKRAELEEKVARGGRFIGNWIKYARWEALQGSFDRMRSVMERALPMHNLNANLWRDYGELEATHGFVEQARTVYQRGVATLPAEVGLWLKLLLLEQAAGRFEQVEEVFQQWARQGGGLENTPAAAYELHVLWIAERIEMMGGSLKPVGVCSAEHIRSVLRCYVEAYNVPTAWLFYATTETHLIRDSQRATDVLRTALQLLPAEMCYGPGDCRVPLALADVLAECGKMDEARAVYQTLVQRVSEEFVDEALRSFRRFERLQQAATTTAGDAATPTAGAEAAVASRASFLESRRRYERRIREHPDDFDAVVCLYALLEEEGSGETEAILWTAVAQRPESPVASQQHAALVCELASVVSAAARREGNVIRQHPRAEEVRHLFASTIKRFPFDKACCPALWLDAAAFEVSAFGDAEQARRLLKAGFQVTKDVEVLDALLRLEEDCYLGRLNWSPTQPPEAEDRYLQLSRDAFQMAIKAAPLELTYWQRYAKWEEEKERQAMKGGDNPAAAAAHHARALLLYRSCFNTLTAEANRLLTVSLSQRYVILRSADQMWGRYMLVARRLLRSALRQKPTVGDDERQQQAIQKSITELRAAAAELLSEVAAAYRLEALTWCRSYREEQRQQQSGGGSVAGGDALAAAAAGPWSVPPPVDLPGVLKPAALRLREACDATVHTITTEVVPASQQLKHMMDASSGGGEEEVNTPELRRIFQSLVEKETAAFLEALQGGGEDGQQESAVQYSYEEKTCIQGWRDFLVGPVIREWARYEAVSGGSESLEAMTKALAASSTASASGGSAGRRRTRLFRKS